MTPRIQAGPGVAPVRRLWLAYVTGAFGLAATAQVNFLVPLRAHELGASFEVIGLIVGAGAAAPAILAVTTGAIIDRLGAKRTFVIGTGATALLSGLFMFVTRYWWFLLLQPLLGIVRNLGWLASQTYITGLGDEDQRQAIAGRFAFFTNGGQMVAPAMIGGVAQLAGFRWAFLFLSGYAAAFAVIGVLLPSLPRDNSHASAEGHGTGIRSALEMLALPWVQAMLLLSAVRLWVMWTYTAFMPAYMIEHGLQSATVGTVLATYGVLATVMAPTTAFWTRYASGPTVAILGLTFGVLGLLVAPHLMSVPAVYLTPVLIGIGHGISLPLLLTIMGGEAPAGKRGVTLGLRGAANQAAAATGPALVGSLIGAAGMGLGFTVAAMAGAAMLLGAHLLHVSAARQPREA